jgi:DNA-binding CsgD family transcriptional regulator
MVMPGAETDPGLIAAIYDAAIDAARWPQVLARLARESNSASARLLLDHFATSGGHPVFAGTRSECERRPARLELRTQTRLEQVSVLTPHLRRALELNRIIGELTIVRDLACEALQRLRFGVLVVEAEARVLLANRAAEAILADPHGALRRERQRLTARRHTDCAVLSRLIGMAVRSGSGGSFVISRDGRPAVIVLVMPARGAADGIGRRPGHAIVLVKDLERPAKRSSSAFSRYFVLTPAQAALANEIVRGDGVRSAARRLRISYGTARAHLLQIFQKTGVRRQTELVRLMSDWDDGISQLADAAPGGGWRSIG